MPWRKSLFPLGLTLGFLLFLQQVWMIYTAIRQEGLHFSQPIYLLLALSFSTGAYFLQMLAWNMIMQYMGIHSGLRQTLKGYFLSFLPRYIPGSVWGYWSRSHWLKQSYGVEYTNSTFASVLEALGLSLTALTAVGAYFSASLEGFSQLALGFVSMGVLILTWLAVPRVTLALGRRLHKGRSPLSHEWSQTSFRAWSIAITLYLVLWVLHGSSVFFASRAVLSIPPTNLLGIIAITTLSWLGGFAAVIVPAGIGVRELTLSALLTTHANLIPWQASLIAIVFRLVLILSEVEWLMVGLGLHIHNWWKDHSQHEVLPRCKER